MVGRLDRGHDYLADMVATMVGDPRVGSFGVDGGPTLQLQGG